MAGIEDAGILERFVGAAPDGIRMTSTLIRPFALYHGAALRVAFSSENFDMVVKRSYGSMRIKWRSIPKGQYISQVRDFIEELSRRQDCSAEDLSMQGFSLRAAELYLSYLRGEFVPEAGQQRCNFSLGCPFNIEDFETGQPIFHLDHVQAETYGGTELQPMCAYHNRVKSDLPLFDLSSFERIVTGDVP